MIFEGDVHFTFIKERIFTQFNIKRLVFHIFEAQA